MFIDEFGVNIIVGKPDIDTNNAEYHTKPREIVLRKDWGIASLVHEAVHAGFDHARLLRLTDDAFEEVVAEVAALIAERFLGKYKAKKGERK